MSQAEKIIAKFGGVRPLARALGHNNPSTVQGWTRRGYVPAWHQRAVLQAAQREQVDLKPEHFFEFEAV